MCNGCTKHGNESAPSRTMQTDAKRIDKTHDKKPLSFASLCSTFESYIELGWIQRPCKRWKGNIGHLVINLKSTRKVQWIFSCIFMNILIYFNLSKTTFLASKLKAGTQRKSTIVTTQYEFQRIATNKNEYYENEYKTPHSACANIVVTPRQF